MPATMKTIINAEPKNNRGIQCKGYLTFMGVWDCSLVFLFHTELRFIAVPGKDGGAGFAFLYLLVYRFSYSVWDRILCLSVPLGVSFGGKSFPPTCRFVGLTHPCRRILMHFLLRPCFGTWEFLVEF
jgi:hypothetical protein